MSLVQKAIHLCFTTDGWKDDVKHDSYIVLTAHFINHNWKMCSHVLETTMMEGSLTGARLQEEIRGILKEWGISNVPRTLVTDQGSNMLCAARISQVHHLDCFDHILDLCLTT